MTTYALNSRENEFLFQAHYFLSLPQRALQRGQAPVTPQTAAVQERRGEESKEGERREAKVRIEEREGLGYVCV